MRLESKLAIGAVVILGMVFGFGLLAYADTCRTFSNHNGFVPGSYDYGEFTENNWPNSGDTHVVVVETNGQNINVPPPAGRNSWDIVRKCNYTTTTTSSTTTTTVPEPSTTTTTIPTTTTTQSPTTTSQPTTTTTFGTTTTSEATTTTSQPTTTSSTSTVPTTLPPTTPPTTDPPTTPETLPFTGAGESFGLAALAGVALSVLGVLVVRSGREVDDG